MVIDECIGRLEGYGYAVSKKLTTSRWPLRKIYMDGHDLRVGLAMDRTGSVTGIDCYSLKNGHLDCLLGTTTAYPESVLKRIWASGIGMDEMLSVLSEPGKAVMRFGAMRLEEELDVLEG